MADENKWSVGLGGKLPIGFGLNLAANENAMAAFSSMSDEEKQRIVDESTKQKSKAEMAQFVNKLGDSFR